VKWVIPDCPAFLQSSILYSQDWASRARLRGVEKKLLEKYCGKFQKQKFNNKIRIFNFMLKFFKWAGIILCMYLQDFL
jgi:hypothetical protein